MAGYLGHKPKISNYTVDEFTTSSAQASSGNFTLSQTVSDSKTLEISVGGIDQPQSAYTISGTTLAFGASIVTLGDIVIARHAGESISYPSLEAGAVTASTIGTGAITIAKLGADAIDGTKIADNAIDSEHYTDGSIDAAHFSVGLGGALSLDASPDTDHTANGPQTNTLASGYSSTIMDLVYLGSSSKWLEADSDATGTAINLLGIALEAKTDTQAMNVALPGSFVRDDSWSWTPGVPLYMSGTLGAITATKPTGTGDVVRTVGYAVHADYIFFAPSSDYVTLA